MFNDMRVIVGLSVDDCGAVLPFDDWLASVTERINQTMHYQFDGEYTLQNSVSVDCE